MANKLQFLSISAFKQRYNHHLLQVVDAPKTPGALAVLADGDSWYRCAKNLNTKEHMAFVADIDSDNWCLCNVAKPAALNVRATIG
jgi:hypothetical protein